MLKKLIKPKYLVTLQIALTGAFSCLDGSVQENDFCINDKEEFRSQQGLYEQCSYWKPPIRFYAKGEYLYWKTAISNLDLNIGVTNLFPNIEDGLFISQRFDVKQNFKWGSGYRIGVGAQFCRNITLEALWTQYSDIGHKTIRAFNCELNQGAKVSLQQIDVMLAYTFACTNIRLKPFLELRATKIKSNLNSYFGIAEFKDHQDFKGLGPSLGLYGDWILRPGFGIYGEVGVSALYGNYRLDFEELDSSDSSNRHSHCHKSNPTIDLGIGLFSKTCICQLEVGFKIGYEFHKYYNASYLGYKRGDVTFNGFVASLEMAF